MGVPDRHRCILPRSRRTERAVMVLGFLMFWASSKMMD